MLVIVLIVTLESIVICWKIEMEPRMTVRMLIIILEVVLHVFWLVTINLLTAARQLNKIHPTIC